MEAALNSADADREEACAELAATMKKEVCSHLHIMSMYDYQRSPVTAAATIPLLLLLLRVTTAQE